MTQIMVIEQRKRERNKREEEKGKESEKKRVVFPSILGRGAEQPK